MGTLVNIIENVVRGQLGTTVKVPNIGTEDRSKQTVQPKSDCSFTIPSAYLRGISTLKIKPFIFKTTIVLFKVSQLLETLLQLLK